MNDSKKITNDFHFSYLSLRLLWKILQICSSIILYFNNLSMKLSVVQFSPEFGNKINNVNRLVDFSESIDSQIIVFPELCTTGYFFTSRDETSKLAENFKGETYCDLSEIAKKKNKIIIYGFIESESDKIYNSAAIIMPDENKSRVYRKTHLFYKERFCFDPGNTGFFVVEDKNFDIKIGTMICYDWRFPESSRSLGILGADLIVCPSNLITNIWPLVMPARAIENKVYLAVANRFGIEERENEKLNFNGLSGIWSYNGTNLAQATSAEDAVLTVEIEPEYTRNKSFNDFNDIFLDRRPEMYAK